MKAIYTLLFIAILSVTAGAQVQERFKKSPSKDTTATETKKEQPPIVVEKSTEEPSSIFSDDLSISYGYHESEQHQDDASNITLEGTSIQASYTVGGASIKFAETSVDNQKYQSGTNRDGRTIALTLAF